MQLAYATIGDGPALVKAANWLSHLDYDWGSPVWRHWWRELSQRFRFVRYDDRGCGLSDRVLEGYDLDTWVRDLETVVDAAGLERFALLGVSRGGPVAITYAARHPERVTHLVLYGTFLLGRRAARHDARRSRRGRRAGAARAARMGKRHPGVPPGLRGPVHPQRIPGAVGPVRRAATPHHHG